MIYIIAFIISLSLLFFGYQVKSKNKVASKIFIVLGLIVPCIIAGLRHYTVGTDTKGYVLNLYKIAQESISFKCFLKLSNTMYNSKDIAYLSFTYLFGHYNISFQLLLFVFEFLIIIPIYAALKKIKNNDYDVVFGMAIIYFVLFNQSLNMIRQAIAISFFLFSFAIFVKSKNKDTMLVSLLLFLISFGFHDTVLFTSPLYILFLLLNSKKIKESSKNFVVVITIVMAILVLVFHKQILLFVGNNGIYPKALWYLEKYSSFDIDFTGTMKNLFIVSLIYYMKDFLVSEKVNYKFAILVAILNLIIAFLGTFINYSERIAYYFMYLVLINYVSLIPKKKKKEIIFTLLVLLVFACYWIITILLNNGSETLPYKLFFWGSDVIWKN